MPTAWSPCSLWARTSRHPYPHAIPCGPNSSPLFPPQVGRNSPLCIPGLRTPGPALAHPHVHAPAHAHTYGQGRSLELYVGNEWDRPGLALALDSLPEVEVSRMIKCKHGSRDVRGRGSFGVSTFGGKESRAHNHLGKTSWDWCQGLIAQALLAPIVTSPIQGAWSPFGASGPQMLWLAVVG